MSANPRVLASLLLTTVSAFVLWFCPVAASAASADVVSTTLTPNTATVGDRLTLTIVVEHDTGVSIDVPGFGADFGGLEPTSVASPTSEEHNNRARTTLGYTLVAFRPGDYTVPPMQIAWHTTGGGRGSTSSEGRTVHTATVLPPGETELRPLKPQIDLGDPAPNPVLPVLFVALFAALTAYGYSLVARAINARPAPAPAAPGRTPVLPPEARARAALDALGAADDDPRAYYAAIAATIRRYLSERFDFAAYAMTRRELERSAEAAGIDRWPARLTANLLEQCDAVQFAGFRPARERTVADLDAAYEIISLTVGSADGGSELQHERATQGES